ncbi:MAG: DUF4870 domain-containing protein [Dactylosporangium sp.]|nr:DUF4870 domain-containing protein [Dactylosporangium sp.]NNJ62272.1 DUF4870 domain-containing protein [Dactylosporangium sp.]
MTQPPYPPGGTPAGYASNDEKTWALIAHFGGAVVGFLAPLVVFLAKGPQSPTVRAHAVAALNFQIVCSATLLALGILRVCGFFLPNVVGWLLSLASFAVWVVAVVFAVLGGLRANEGQVYRYPIQVGLVK